MSSKEICKSKEDCGPDYCDGHDSEGFPGGWKLVPVEPTPEMVSAAEEAHMPFGDMDIALRMAILSAPSAPAPVQGEAVAWARQCDLDESDPAIFVAREEVQESGYLVPLYTTPQPAPAQDVAGLLEWAVDRWHAEVASRPLANVHRRSLDDTWRQVIRKLGGDAGLLCGPAHDALAAHDKQSSEA